MAFLRAAALADLWEGEMIGVRVAGVPVLLVRLDDGLHAYVDRCAHQAVPLSEGVLDGGVIVCGAHGWSYDARTGRGVNPARARLSAIPVRAEGADILVDVGAAAARAGGAP